MHSKDEKKFYHLNRVGDGEKKDNTKKSVWMNIFFVFVIYDVFHWFDIALLLIILSVGLLDRKQLILLLTHCPGKINLE